MVTSEQHAWFSVQQICQRCRRYAGVAAPVARPQYNPWEITIVVGATILFVVFFFVMLGLALAFPHQATVPYILIGLLVVGLGICGLRLAGLWPFSAFFPKPNFSSRNLPGGKPAGTNIGATSLHCLEFWMAINRGNYAQAWEATAPMFQRTTSKEEWVSPDGKVSGVRSAKPCPPNTLFSEIHSRR